jgi:nitronate monooxygenase
MTKMPSIKLRNTEVRVPIIQGGMGIGLSSYTLAGAVAREGGLGVLSSAGLDRIVSQRHGKKFKAREAAAQDVRDAKILGQGGAIGMNIMVAVINQYEDSVLGSMDGGVDAIISGAGLPMALPEIALRHERHSEVALVPIVSSGRAMEVIFKRWKRTGRLPDAVVVEGPRAGGHIAWRDVAEAHAPENHLDNLLKQVFEVVKDWGNIPVIAAGGVYTHEDIVRYIDMGCAGVQMGTRFLATYESGANTEYKKMLVECKEEDIELASKPGSPCGMLFHVIKQSPFYQQAVARERAPKCDKGYLLNKGHCPSKHENEKTFCICNGLLASIDLNNQNEKNLYTVGANAHRIDRIMSVHELMAELQGLVTEGSLGLPPVTEVRAHQRVAELS